jgi:hypothetical protein
MATGAEKVPGGWGIGRKRANNFEAMSTGRLPFPDADPSIRRFADIFPLPAVLLLAASLLLSACADADNGKKNDPVIFGGAGAGNGGAGATSGVSLSW